MHVSRPISRWAATVMPAADRVSTRADRMGSNWTRTRTRCAVAALLLTAVSAVALRCDSIAQFGVYNVGLHYGGINFGRQFSLPTGYWCDSSRSDSLYLKRGFHVGAAGSYRDPLLVIFVPLWPFIAAYAVATVRPWRPTRSEPGCRACGYSLVGLANSAPCPECGKHETRLLTDVDLKQAA